jgi:hypothetical protein
MGPGFDASDLKRGDVTPHEQVRVRRDEHLLIFQSRVVATADVQRAARSIRFDKVAAMLGCRLQDVEPQLRQRGETLLLDVTTYPAIPETLVADAVNYAGNLRPALKAYGLHDKGVSISLSFLGKDARPVFWDVVWPRCKYVVNV